MVLRICKYGEKVLREKAQPVVCVTDDLRRLADDMVETMHQAKGVGLAAEQAPSIPLSFTVAGVLPRWNT